MFISNDQARLQFVPGLSPINLLPSVAEDPVYPVILPITGVGLVSARRFHMPVDHAHCIPGNPTYFEVTCSLT